jgi:predicted XRE-type DNA-binding protein
VVPSSGNAFTDLGVTDAEEKQTKVRLAVAISQIIQGRKLSQTAAARRLNVNQPKVSALSNYQLDGFSVQRLMNFVPALDRDVDIVIRRKPKSRNSRGSSRKPVRDEQIAKGSRFDRGASDGRTRDLWTA